MRRQRTPLSNGGDRITVSELTGKPPERAAARDIVDKYGHSSLDLFNRFKAKFEPTMVER